MKILITGGCGFVGSNLAVLFRERYPGMEVTCLDNLNRRGSELNLKRVLASGATFIHGDVRHLADIRKAGPADLIIEAAAEPSVLAGSGSDLQYLIDTNLNGTINTLYAAKEWGAGLVFLSTSRVYPYDRIEKLNITTTDSRFVLGRQQEMPGVSENGISERFPLDGVRSMYGATKLSSELIIREFCQNFGLHAVINRCGVLTGPYQMGKIDQGVVVLWMARHYWKKKLGYIGFGGEGLQVRDMLHVRDLFALIDHQVKHITSYSGEIFNAGGGTDISVSLKELTGICEQLTGNSIQIIRETGSRPGDIPVYITDNARVTEATGWKPETGVTAIMTEIYDWIRTNEQELEGVLAN